MSNAEPFVSKSGETITDEIAEQIADEAEAGYDVDELAETARPGPGRKSLAGAAGKSPAIQLRLAPDVYERLRAAAAETGASISELVRDAIDRQLKRIDRAARR